MLQSERHERIAQYVREHDFLSVEEAVRLFDASPATVRRDFGDLAGRNVVTRVRGGVRAQRSQQDEVLPFALREVHYSREKAAVACQAVAMFQPQDTIIVDGGTTTFHLANCMPDENVRVITNSVRLAAAMDQRRSDISEIDICLTGGILYHRSGVLLGPNTEASLRQYHAQWSLLSVGGITAEGITNTNELVIETERVMIERCDRVIILADHSKIGKQAMCHVCDCSKIDYLITDKWPENERILDEIRAQGVEVITVSP